MESYFSICPLSNRTALTELRNCGVRGVEAKVALDRAGVALLPLVVLEPVAVD